MSNPEVLGASIREFYGRRANSDEGEVCIYPFIGDRFAAGSQCDLRVMALGINSYWNFDEERPTPEMFAKWYETEKGESQGKPFVHNGFMKRVKREIDTICTHLTTESGSPFHRLSYMNGSPDNHYLTDVIKRYTTLKEGRYAKDLKTELVKEHSDHLREELEILAQHDRFPHVILLFWSGGDVAWEAMWETLHPEGPTRFGRAKIGGVNTKSFFQGSGVFEHCANHIIVDVNGKTPSLLLLRLCHPSRAGKRKAAYFTGTECQAFQELLEKGTE